MLFGILQQSPLLFEALCSPVCFWILLCWLYCMLLADSWALVNQFVLPFVRIIHFKVNSQVIVLEDRA